MAEINANVSTIAVPLADAKWEKRIFKLVKKANHEKLLKRGVKEVMKNIRKGQKGLVIMAGDVSPVDVLSHVPVSCEDNAIAYMFVTSKTNLGLASSTKRATSCVMLCEGQDEDYKTYYDKVYKKISSTDYFK